MQYFMNRTYRDRDFEFTNGKWQAHTFILFIKNHPPKTLCTLTIKYVERAFGFQWHMKLEAASWKSMEYETLFLFILSY